MWESERDDIYRIHPIESVYCFWDLFLDR